MRRLAPTKKAWFICSGGPWSEKGLLLPSQFLIGKGATLQIAVREYRGRYIYDSPNRVRWEPR